MMGFAGSWSRRYAHSTATPVAGDPCSPSELARSVRTYRHHPGLWSSARTGAPLAARQLPPRPPLGCARRAGQEHVHDPCGFCGSGCSYGCSCCRSLAIAGRRACAFAQVKELGERRRSVGRRPRKRVRVQALRGFKSHRYRS